MMLFKAPILALFVTGLAHAQDSLQWCGTQRYDPSMYTCYNGNSLCPILAGGPTLVCGEACYNQFYYECHDNAITPKAEDPNFFTLLAYSPTRFANTVIQACGQRFWIQNSTACSYCPDIVTQQGGRCPDGTATVLNRFGGMDVNVPGGQLAYIAPDGAFGFTQAHSSATPSGSLFDFDAFQQGAFFVRGAWGWRACEASAEDQARGKHYQIFAALPNLVLPASCFELLLLTVDWDQEKGPAAWQYT